MTWERFLLGLVTSGISTLGFCLLLKLNPKRIPAAVIGGMLTNLVYDAVVLSFGNLLLAAFSSSLFMALYSEISAKIFRAPAILFIVPCAIPIVPGSYLYYTGYYLLTQQTERLAYYAKGTLQIGLGIAVGMGVASILIGIGFHVLRYLRARIHERV
ncbi:MAG: threonine/serine exporter family protein [Clostridia bacterium]|nr:threonine/serine exporter family protein [Clostridia bacterium]